MPTNSQQQLEDEGYFVARGLLDKERDLEPLVVEYDQLVTALGEKLYRLGELSGPLSDLPFAEKLMRLASETKGAYYQALDISLPLNNISEDTPIHLGQAVFDLIRNPRLLDVVETFIGPEIFANPVQHVRIKPPEGRVPDELRRNALVSTTAWHQDQGVLQEDADESEILTVWLPVTEATEENGCLVVVPGSHRSGLARHCSGSGPTHIPEDHVASRQVTLPMEPGDVLFMHRLTQHSALPNRSESIRWSFDLRYNPVGQPTGRSSFPGFVARSRKHPEHVLSDCATWQKDWLEARRALAQGGTPRFNRWDPNDPLCA